MTLLAQYLRRAAHGRHRCGWCGERIAQGEVYVDQRIAADRSVFTWREHRTCGSEVWRWLGRAGCYDIEGLNPRDVYAEMLAEKQLDPPTAVG